MNFENTWTQIEVDFGEFKTDIIAEIKLEEVKDTAYQFVDVVKEFNSIVGNWTMLQVDLQTDIDYIANRLNDPVVCNAIDTISNGLCAQWLATVNVTKDQIDQITIDQSIVSTEQLLSLIHISEPTRPY